LELQLNDVTFRQNILVQFLIIFQYLVLPVKFKQTQQSLNEEQSQWIKKTTNQINEVKLFQNLPVILIYSSL
jgi:hypothetical protein